MCFSAEASFTAAAVLGIIGILCIRKVSHSSQLLLAIIPLIFAIQQLSEGFLWISLDQLDKLDYVSIWKYVYLSFAFIVWPLWIPLAITSIETSVKHKRWQYIFLAIGALYSACMILNFCYRWPPDAIQVQIHGHSLQYHLPIQNEIAYSLIYFLPTLVTPFLSSFRKIWVIGFVNAVTLIIAYSFYQFTFISVWCFFAALASLSIYALLATSSSEIKKKDTPNA